MSDEFQPANQNVSFTSLTQNPLRQRTDEELARTLTTLEEEGVPPSLLAEALFDFLLVEMEPGEPVDVERAITWYSQLNRFSDVLIARQVELEKVYDEVGE